MSDQQDVRIGELRQFLKAYRISNSLEDQNFLNSFVAFERDLYALLLWGLYLESYNADESSLNKLRFAEALSDISASVFCLISGLSKLSMISARSAVENFVRGCLSLDGYKVENITSVYELNDMFKDSASGMDAELSKRFGSIVESYALLCKYAHSADAKHMTLSIPFRDLFSASSSKKISNLASIHKIVKNFNCVLLVKFAGKIELPAKKRDKILDQIPRSVKRAVSAL